MKYKSLLFLFIILQCISCNKRYIFLKKVRVPHDSKKESVAIEQKRKTTKPFHPDEGPGFDTIENRIPDEANGSSKPILIPNKQWKDPKPKSFIHPDIKPDKSDLQKKGSPTTGFNQRALFAFIYTILAIASALSLFVLPLIMSFLLAAIFAVATFYNARIAIIELKQTPQKGKWMAVVGLVFVGLVSSGILALAIILLFTANSYQVNNAAVLTAFIALTIGIFVLLMRSFLHVKEPKTPLPPQPKSPGQRPSPPIKPNDPRYPAPDKWNRLAIAAFIIGLLAAMMFLATAFFFLTYMMYTAILFLILASLFFLGTVLLGIKAFRQIQSTHRKGKRLTWMGILFTPFVFAFIFPPLLVLYFLIGLIWWLINRHKLKKENKASLS